MITRLVTVTPDQYVLLTSQAEFAILNRDSSEIRVILGSDTAPAADASNYFLFTKDNGLLSSQVPNSKVWARSHTAGSSDIIVAD